MREADYEAQALDALKRAVSEALERKRKLGQYAVVWRDGRSVCIGPDAPPLCYPHGRAAVQAPSRGAEPGEE
jgi:hypothetical protein